MDLTEKPKSQSKEVSAFMDKMTPEQKVKADELLSRATYLSQAPLALVENIQWQKLFKFLRPAYQIPTRHLVSGPLLDSEHLRVKAMVSENIGMRANYKSKLASFLEKDIEVKEPYDLFEKWFKLVKEDPRTVEANAMCVSTATKDGFPSARYCLLKGFTKDGFIFFTHYTSRKGKELEENPRAALTFYWEHFNRSVRIEGDVEKLPFSDADEYFSKRPYRSQIGALCSNQSIPVEGRHILEQKAEELASKYSEGQVPRPPLWGGYLVKPRRFEFWQGQTDRIHDRIIFRKPSCPNEPDGIVTHPAEDGWVYERLNP